MEPERRLPMPRAPNAYAGARWSAPRASASTCAAPHPANDGGVAMSRRSRLVWVAGTLTLAIVVVVILALVSARGGESAARPAAVVDLSGIPQSGAVLGQASAPVEILEFADLQCPFCAQAAASTLPGAIDRWVRPGTARIVFEPLAFIGP